MSELALISVLINIVTTISLGIIYLDVCKYKAQLDDEIKRLHALSKEVELLKEN
jgi:hypothetical protein